MKPSYDIRKINGQDVFVKQIDNGFWLINDVFLVIGFPCDMTDSDVESFLDKVHGDKFFDYAGAMNGQVAVFSLCDDSYILDYVWLPDFLDKSVAKKGQCALDEYRKYIEF